jgi:hypothetical protein
LPKYNFLLEAHEIKINEDKDKRNKEMQSMLFLRELMQRVSITLDIRTLKLRHPSVRN